MFLFQKLHDKCYILKLIVPVLCKWMLKIEMEWIDSAIVQKSFNVALKKIWA